MKKRATLALVRPTARRDRSLDEDVALAREIAGQPPCWVVLVGGERAKRLKSLRGALGVDGISKDGVSVHAPVAVSGEDWTEDDARELPNRLARYLADVGLRMPLKRYGALEIRLDAGFDLPLVVAVAEAVAVYPRVDLRVGEQMIESSLRWELRRDRFRAPPPELPTTDLIGESPPMLEALERVRRYARLPYPVLVLGETGTGKELVAARLHEESGREGLFMPTNAARLSPELADSQLFGHVPGAFTGATHERMGRIREAEGGTFFLDEVFDLHPAVQAKLLRALNRAEEGIIDVEPLGSTRQVKVHARLVVAAQRDPRGEPGAGSRMREDLFFRVAVGIIQLPPLRERPGDLPRLCRHLLHHAGAAVTVTEDALSILGAHGWPGNVRELRLVLLRALVDGPPGAEQLTADVVRDALQTAALPAGTRSLPLKCDLALELKRIEVATLRAALRVSGDRPTAAGCMVGLGANARNFPRTLENAEKRLRQMESSDDP